MSLLTENIPFERVLIRREYTTGDKRGHGEYLQGFVHAVTSYMGRQLSFQVCFTEPGYGGTVPRLSSLWLGLTCFAIYPCSH